MFGLTANCKSAQVDAGPKNDWLSIRYINAHSCKFHLMRTDNCAQHMHACVTCKFHSVCKCRGFYTVKLVLHCMSLEFTAMVPKLLEMLADFPLKIELEGNVILQVMQASQLAVVPPLAAWNISGVDSEIRAFQKS